jgi:hypothetical protein
MLGDQLRSSRKYVDENEYVAGPLIPCVFEQTVAGDVHSPDGNEGTLKFRVSLRNSIIVQRCGLYVQQILAHRGFDYAIENNEECRKGEKRAE